MKPVPRGGSLPEWLAWLEGLDPDRITPGLERVTQVGRRLDVLRPADYVVNIAGTNGKGSSAALLEQTLLHAGHRVAVYSSPHLLHYNERLRINDQAVESGLLCQAFEQVASVQDQTPLSYFEFGTLAVLWIIRQLRVEVAILEVGLGGRLDAVNAVDADCALITSIGLDHQDWLGQDRESIGREKAGIMRAGRPVVCNDPQAPASIASTAAQQGAQLLSYGVDYSHEIKNGNWCWTGLSEQIEGLPEPAMPGTVYRHNAAGVIAVLLCMRRRLPWTQQHLHSALTSWSLPGRAQCLELQGRRVCLDVAHNAEAAAALAGMLRQTPVAGRTIAVFAALKGKPIGSMMQHLKAEVDDWHLAGLSTQPRGLSVTAMLEEAGRAGLQYTGHSGPSEAWHAALQASEPGDRLVVLGSFHTVQAVLEELNSKETQHG